MTLRTVALIGAVCLSVAACPTPTPAPDAGPIDAGPGEQPQGTCTSPCGANQVCDPQRHACVDPCGGCDGAGVCVKNAQGAWGCVPRTTSCNGQLCAAGQATCVSGGCSCEGFTRASRDSCAAEGQICRAPFNPVSANGGTCDSPRLYEECRTDDCPSGSCAPCPTGHVCTKGIFGADVGACLRRCPGGSANECNVDEFCDGQSRTCYPRTFFVSPDCRAREPAILPDGGVGDGGYFAVPVSNTCVLTSGTGQDTEPLPGGQTGNCSYAMFRLATQLYPIPVCRPPGAVGLGGVCKRDFSPGAIAVQCGTGLECMVTEGETGVCLKMCNAADPIGAVTPQPACGAGESCVNIYRFEERGAVLGVCMKACNVFSPTSSACADYGPTKASCVPTSADGRLLVTTDGSGLCVPQHTAVAQVGQPCAEPDPLKGAACANGLHCLPGFGAAATSCAQPCDLPCASATPPTRCSTEANATCPAGKRCLRVTSTSGTILGFCG